VSWRVKKSGKPTDIFCEVRKNRENEERFGRFYVYRVLAE
jgi:hypothetical protein